MDKVHQQYEAYPYPRRDPRDEAERLLVMSPSHLPEVIHTCMAAVGAVHLQLPAPVAVPVQPS